MNTSLIVSTEIRQPENSADIPMHFISTHCKSNAETSMIKAII